MVAHHIRHVIDVGATIDGDTQTRKDGLTADKRQRLVSNPKQRQISTTADHRARNVSAHLDAKPSTAGDDTVARSAPRQHRDEAFEPVNQADGRSAARDDGTGMTGRAVIDQRVADDGAARNGQIRIIDNSTNNRPVTFHLNNAAADSRYAGRGTTADKNQTALAERHAVHSPARVIKN